MTALPCYEPPTSRPSQPRRRRPLPPRHRDITLEISLKLLINGLLSCIALATLIKLLPYQWIQLQNLREVRVEVEDTQQRVDHLREQLSRNFDPHQTRKVMQEQSPRIDPNQRRIIMVKKAN